MIIHSEISGEGILPWRSGRVFRLWRYGIGHSQLLLRSPGNGENETLSILFEAVEFMRLRRSYADLVLRLAGEEEGDWFEAIKSTQMPVLRVVLAGRADTGLVACSRVTVRTVSKVEDDSWTDGATIFSVIRQSSSG